MPLTIPAAIEAYRRDSTLTRVYWFGVVPAATDLTPTRAEMALSTTVDITSLYVSHAGMSLTIETTTVPSVGGGDPQTASGSKSVGTPTLVLKSDLQGVDGNGIIDVGDLGVLLVMPAGDDPGSIAQARKLRCILVDQGEEVTDFARTTFTFAFVKSNDRVVIPASS